MKWSFVALLVLVWSGMSAAQPVAQFVEDTAAVRVKELARLESVRENQLNGLGLVIGLEGTGDGRGSQANVQMVANMLDRFGVSVNASDLRLRNVAAVMVSATLPAFARPGDQIDVTVSSIGDARSLQGGFLLQTPLTAANGDVYAVAQGPVSIGGFNVRTNQSSVQRNHAAVGYVSNGGIVEQGVPIQLLGSDSLTWVLRQPDFVTASRVAEAINEAVDSPIAKAIDQSAIWVDLPDVFREDPIPFIALVEELEVTPDAVAKVVINERTGTVVLGHDVRISTVAVAHGGLSVRIESEYEVVQPPPFSDGETVITERSRITETEEKGQLTVLQPGSSVQDLVHALNSVGASPRDIIAILQAIKASGALYGQLEVM